MSSTIYFVSLVLIGQKIILNLFVAILLENFDEGVLRQKMHDYEQKQRGVIKDENWALTKWKKFLEVIKNKVKSVKFVKNHICCCLYKKED